MKYRQYLQILFLSLIIISTAQGTSLFDCQEITESGEYKLVSNIDGYDAVCFNISANDVTIDCNGKTIVGTGGETTFYLKNVQGIYLADCQITSTVEAIYAYNTSQVTVTDFNVDSEDEALNILLSDFFTVTSSSFENSEETPTLSFTQSNDILLEDLNIQASEEGISFEDGNSCEINTVEIEGDEAVALTFTDYSSCLLSDITTNTREGIQLKATTQGFNFSTNIENSTFVTSEEGITLNKASGVKVNRCVFQREDEDNDDEAAAIHFKDSSKNTLSYVNGTVIIFEGDSNENNVKNSEFNFNGSTLIFDVEDDVPFLNIFSTTIFNGTVDVENEDELDYVGENILKSNLFAREINSKLVGNIWPNLNCIEHELRSGYEVCTNASEYTISEEFGFIDPAPMYVAKYHNQSTTNTTTNESQNSTNTTNTTTSFLGELIKPSNAGTRLSYAFNISGDPENETQTKYSDIHTLTIRTSSSSEKILSLDHNFSNSSLNLSNMSILRSLAPLNYIIIKDLDLEDSEEKTLYLPIKLNSSKICILDAELNSSTDFSQNCSGVQETLINCPYTDTQYTCTIVDKQYQISGLKHSGMYEMKEEQETEEEEEEEQINESIIQPSPAINESEEEEEEEEQINEAEDNTETETENPIVDDLEPLTPTTQSKTNIGTIIFLLILFIIFAAAFALIFLDEYLPEKVREIKQKLHLPSIALPKLKKKKESSPFEHLKSLQEQGTLSSPITHKQNNKAQYQQTTNLQQSDMKKYQFAKATVQKVKASYTPDQIENLLQDAHYSPEIIQKIMKEEFGK